MKKRLCNCKFASCLLTVCLSIFLPPNAPPFILAPVLIPGLSNQTEANQNQSEAKQAVSSEMP